MATRKSRELPSCANAGRIGPRVQMSLLLASAVSRYVSFYSQYAASAWANMTPPQYGIVLVSVAVFGWILMKSGSRR